MDWKTAQFMESHLGEEYDALIISVQKFGFFVELFEVFVEGLVAIDRLEERSASASNIARTTTPSSANRIVPAKGAIPGGNSTLATASGCARSVLTRSGTASNSA